MRRNAPCVKRISANPVVSGVFWQTQTDPEGPDEVRYRRPWWVLATLVLDWLLVLVLLPAGLLLLVPFFFLFYVVLAQYIVFVSPVLILGNLLAFVWAIRRRQAGTVALSIVSLFATVASFLILLLWQGQIVVFGIGF